MISSFFISLREGLEVALILSVILINLARLKRRDLERSLYLGISLGIIFVTIAGFLGLSEASILADQSDIFEAVMMLLASGLIIYFIAWISTGTINVGGQAGNNLGNDLSKFSLVTLGFVTIFRDGLELIVFNLASSTVQIDSFVRGTTAGIFVAVVIAYILLKTSLKLNISILFKILGLILIYFGAEMFAEGFLHLLTLKGEIYETVLMVVYILPALYIFLRKNITKQIYKK